MAIRARVVGNIVGLGGQLLGGHIGFLWDSNPQDGEEELGGHVVHHRWASHQMAQKLQRLTALAVTRLSKPGLYAGGGVPARRSQRFKRLDVSFHATRSRARNGQSLLFETVRFIFLQMGLLFASAVLPRRPARDLCARTRR